MRTGFYTDSAFQNTQQYIQQHSISHCAQMRDVLIITILNTYSEFYPFLFSVPKTCFFQKYFSFVQTYQTSIRACKCIEEYVFYACCIYYIFFHTPKKEEKRCQEFLVKSFIAKRKIGIAFFSSSLIRNKNSFLGKKLA